MANQFLPITTFIIILFIPSFLTLECYECDDCINLGRMVTCPANRVNCYVAFGYSENYVGVSKGCSNESATVLGSTFCQGFPEQTLLGFKFSNVTGCLCGNELCNQELLPPFFQYVNPLNYAVQMAGNLKCFQCNPCVDVGVKVLCANGVKNCFQTVGYTNTSTATLIKGCEHPMMSQGKVLAQTCSPKNISAPFNKILTRSFDCLCSTNDCNTMTPSNLSSPVPLPAPPRNVSLKCLVCNSCTSLSDGVLTTCPLSAQNCVIGQGSRDGQVDITKNCSNGLLDSNTVTEKTCYKFTTLNYNNFLYSNVTACVCGTDGCNTDLSSPTYIEGNVTNNIVPPSPSPTTLKCYQCFDCKDEGILTPCPGTATNCYYAEGFNNTQLIKVKGCAGPAENLVSPFTTKQCIPLASYQLQNVTFSNINVCACGRDGCNDELRKVLQCYQCDMCANKGQLVTCSSKAFNCFIMSGKIGLFDLTSKGCYTDLNLRLDNAVCTRYSSVVYAGRTFKQTTSCACPTSECNDRKVPLGALFTPDKSSSCPLAVSKLVLLGAVVALLKACR